MRSSGWAVGMFWAYFVRLSKLWGPGEDVVERSLVYPGRGTVDVFPTSTIRRGRVTGPRMANWWVWAPESVSQEYGPVWGAVWRRNEPWAEPACQIHFSKQRR